MTHLAANPTAKSGATLPPAVGLPPPAPGLPGGPALLAPSAVLHSVSAAIGAALCDGSALETNLPFEFVALEALLVCASTRMHVETVKLEHRVDDSIEAIRQARALHDRYTAVALPFWQAMATPRARTTTVTRPLHDRYTTVIRPLR